MLLLGRYAGQSVVAPDRDFIFNAATLISYTAFRVVREVDGPWVQHIQNQPSPVVVDVGANYGQFMRYCKWLHPFARVYCIEPRADFLHCLRESADSFQVAAGLRVGTTVLHRSGLTGTTGPLYDDAKDRIDEECLCNPLDDIVGHLPVIDLLKIDVDGAELDVLRSATEVLKRTKWLLVECQPRSRAVLETLYGRAITHNGIDCMWRINP
jgi:FkbM family methyltransferase